MARCKEIPKGRLTQSYGASLESNRIGVPVRTVGDAEQEGNRDEQVRKPAYPPIQPEQWASSFLSFISDNPTVFHAVNYFTKQLDFFGYTELSERTSWTDQLTRGGKYYVIRNGSALIAFAIGDHYEAGNGVSMIAAHIDALAAKLKPIPKLSTKAGFVQLGVAPYAGGLNTTWFDRDLGIGGRVLVKNQETGKIDTRLVKLSWPIARIPTLAPHFGAASSLSNVNKETQMVPIVGLDNSGTTQIRQDTGEEPPNGPHSFAATQPEKLVKAIAGELGIENYESIVNWELELYDTQPAELGGLDKEFIFAGRIDDKLCGYAAMNALIASTEKLALASATDCRAESKGTIKLIGLFDNEEIGSLLRQGAHSNFLPSTISRICETFSDSTKRSNVLAQTYANSFLVSADVSHAVNPNYLGSYLENHSPRLNVGVAIQADPNGHTTTDSVSTAFLQRVADKSDSVLQVFQIRNDSRSGGTVGPMLSSAMGVRAIDCGIPQLSMHSIRATTGNQDPGLGIKLFKGFFDHFEDVDAEFA